MPKSDIKFEWETGDPDSDRHSERYFRCLYELIKELRELPEAKPILDKYYAILEDNYGVNLDFPDDFDQLTLPEDLR